MGMLRLRFLKSWLGFAQTTQKSGPHLLLKRPKRRYQAEGAGRVFAACRVWAAWSKCHSFTVNPSFMRLFRHRPECATPDRGERACRAAGRTAGKSYVGSIPQLFPKYKGLRRWKRKDFSPAAPACAGCLFHCFFSGMTLTNRPDAPILKRPDSNLKIAGKDAAGGRRAAEMSKGV